MKLCRTKLMLKGSHFTNPFKLRDIENSIMPVQYTPCCKIVPSQPMLSAKPLNEFFKHAIEYKTVKRQHSIPV